MESGVILVLMSGMSMVWVGVDDFKFEIDGWLDDSLVRFKVGMSCFGSGNF